jgi:hypothetical protein
MGDTSAAPPLKSQPSGDTLAVNLTTLHSLNQRIVHGVLRFISSRIPIFGLNVHEAGTINYHDG